MKKNWIDFKTVKAGASFKTVLDHYGIEYQEKGNELVALCPFHEDSSPSFRANEEKKAFNCFGCKASGNIIEFVVRKEDVRLKKAATLIAEWCDIDIGDGHGSRSDASERTEQQKREGTASPEDKNDSDASEGDTAHTNEPLAFTLKLNPEHPYLIERGIDQTVASTFGLGYCNKGVMRGRIGIPIHDVSGDLVAYCGRWPSNDGIPDGEGKYKLPANFHKHLVLYNLLRVSGADWIILVEGFFSVFRLHQLGYPSVALLGSVLSNEQETLLANTGLTRITVLLDGDKAGREASVEIAGRLARHCFVRIAELPDGEQPDTVGEELLVSIV